MSGENVSYCLETFKILSLNIHKGYSTFGRRFILHELKDSLKLSGADFVFLQEVFGDQTEVLADTVWTEFSYGKNAIYDHGHHGNSILSKFPFAAMSNTDISSSAWERRGFLHGWIELNGQKIHMVCVHLSLFHWHRKNQYEIMVRELQSRIPANEPLIVAGDFNDWRLKAQKFFADPLGLREVFRSSLGKEVRTFPSGFPLLPMDRIYLRGLKIVSVRRLFEAPWTRLSDHIPLMAEVSINGAA